MNPEIKIPTQKCTLGRRDFLKGVIGTGLGVGAAALVGEPEQNIKEQNPSEGQATSESNKYLGINVENPRNLSYEEIKDLAWYYDELIKRLDAGGLKYCIRDEDKLREAANQTSEYFPKVGVTKPYRNPKAPDVYFEHFEDQYDNDRVIAKNYMLSSIAVNARFTDPNDPWYNEPMVLPTMAHEMAHVMGIFGGDVSRAETSAQISSIIVLAAMANDRMTLEDKEVYTYALLYDLRSITMGAIHYDAIKRGDEEDYDSFYKEVFTDPDKQKYYEEGQNKWDEMKEKHMEVLKGYYKDPFMHLLNGLQDGEIPNLFLPINSKDQSAATYMEPKNLTPEPDLPLKTEPLREALITLDENVSRLGKGV